MEDEKLENPKSAGLAGSRFILASKSQFRRESQMTRTTAKRRTTSEKIVRCKTLHDSPPGAPFFACSLFTALLLNSHWSVTRVDASSANERSTHTLCMWLAVPWGDRSASIC